jgi:hypothetical protein
MTVLAASVERRNCGQMTVLHIGDRVEFNGRTFTVRGVSPMSVRPPVAHLAHTETGEQLEVPAEELEWFDPNGYRQAVPPP